MHALKTFCDAISEKTILIYCPDCHSLEGCINHPPVLSFTSFGSVIQNGNYWEETLRHPIEEGGYGNILLAGHVNCSVISFIKRNNVDNPLWLKTKRQLHDISKQLKIIGIEPPDKERVMQHYIATQLRELSCHPFFKEKIKEGAVRINGIVINDLKTCNVTTVSKGLLTFEHN